MSTTSVDAANKKAKNDRVSLEIDGQFAIISLAGEQQSIPVFTEMRIRSLQEALNSLKGNTTIRYLLILGSAQGFCAGADIHMIKAVDSPSLGERLSKFGQEVFGLLESLPLVKVAAIHGACVGGGCELALACDYRIATDASSTKIGLPEIKIGILPGFGGTQRLPQLVGLPQALDIILNGRVLSVRRAQSIGLIDYVLTTNTDSDKILSTLAAKAREVALGKCPVKRQHPSLFDRMLTKTSLGRRVVRSKVEPKLRAKTKGQYPAPLRALEVSLVGLEKGEIVGYREEAKAIGDLVTSPECKSLVHVYLLTESSKDLGRAVKENLLQQQIGVIGAGVMGSGIAVSFLAKGAKVVVVDPAVEARNRCRDHIAASLEKSRELSLEQRKQLLSQLILSEKVDALAGCGIVVEAAVENLQLKKELFQRVASLVGEKTILASNTSSLPISDIAKDLPHPERVVGMHFFNPVEKMPLVEVVRGVQTDERTTLYTAKLATQLGKHPVIVEDVPGFLVNRLLTPYLVEAAQLLSEGYSLMDIDAAALEFGMPMGPFRLLDEVGLDVAGKVAEVLSAGYGERMQGPAYAKKLAESGRLGRKSGAGFYRYEGDETKLDASLPSLLGLKAPEQTSVDRKIIGLRLLLPMVNEAVRSLDEKVAGLVSPDAAGQIDLATVMGMGFPPFRGGVLRFAESLGAEVLFEKLSLAADKHGPRFRPWEGIAERAKKKSSFYQPVP